MKIHNSEIANLFNHMADLLEIKGENPFRVRAYRNAAITINNNPKSISEMAANKEDLTDLCYIGKDLAEKIKTIVQTGSFPALKKLEKRCPPLLTQLMNLEGLGPKRIKKLYDTLHISSIEDLQAAITNNKLSNIKGFGDKIVQQISQGLIHLKSSSHRLLLISAVAIAEPLLVYLKALPDTRHIEIAGSYRRRQETIADLDIVIASEKSANVIAYFIKYEEINKILSRGITRAAVRLSCGIQVDLRVVAPESYGAALLYFTGSKNHNIVLRKIALRKNLKINEYGLFKGKKQIAGKSEEEMYRKIGLNYIEPELRENRGEIEKASQEKFPALICIVDIKGDLHCHTNLTGGTATLEAMVKSALEHNYEYVAITDHSKYLKISKGIDEKMLLKQIKAIDKLNNKFGKIIILKSIELDILEDGSLDFPARILKHLDLTVCAIHSHFHLSRQKQTERLLRAMDNPYFNILAHPTGRLIGKREPYDIDIEKIMMGAKEKHCFMELNAQPTRLDLNDIYCKLAKEMQLKLVISTDAHSISQFSYMQFGIYQARRGWLEAKDVLNTLNLTELLSLLKRS